MLRTALCATFTLGLVAVPAHAGLGGRTATAEYTTAGGVSGDVLTGDSDVNGEHYGTARVFPRKRERFVKLTVADTSGLPVAFAVGQDVNLDGTDDVRFGEFCGSTPEDLKLRSDKGEVVVYILAGECRGAVSAPTKGVVTAAWR